VVELVTVEEDGNFFGQVVLVDDVFIYFNFEK
jgi:hypothetical protein